MGHGLPRAQDFSFCAILWVVFDKLKCAGQVGQNQRADAVPPSEGRRRHPLGTVRSRAGKAPRGWLQPEVGQHPGDNLSAQILQELVRNSVAPGEPDSIVSPLRVLVVMASLSFTRRLRSTRSAE